MESRDQKRVRTALAALAEDPQTRRAGADIKRLVKTEPIKHRIRVGAWRIIYLIKDDTVHIIEVFARGRGYRK